MDWSKFYSIQGFTMQDSPKYALRRRYNQFLHHNDIVLYYQKRLEITHFRSILFRSQAIET